MATKVLVGIDERREKTMSFVLTLLYGQHGDVIACNFDLDYVMRILGRVKHLAYVEEVEICMYTLDEFSTTSKLQALEGAGRDGSGRERRISFPKFTLTQFIMTDLYVAQNLHIFTIFLNLCSNEGVKISGNSEWTPTHAVI